MGAIVRIFTLPRNAKEKLGWEFGLSLQAELCATAGDIQDETSQPVLAGVADASLQGTRMTR
jgi:hypothetical protein